MRHPKVQVPIVQLSAPVAVYSAPPVAPESVIDWNQDLEGETVASGEAVKQLFARGLFWYQFLQNRHDPSRRSRVMRCSHDGEAEWLTETVDQGGLIVAVPIP
jgi:hypothetical protein